MDRVNSFSNLLNRDNFDKLKKLITSAETFGMRIVITAPDYDEALFGLLGTENDYHYTILSRFMNMLARAENAVGRWEKDKIIPLAPAHCFLLWYADTLPSLSNIKFEECKKDAMLRDFDVNMNIYRVERIEEFSLNA